MIYMYLMSRLFFFLCQKNHSDITLVLLHIHWANWNWIGCEAALESRGPKFIKTVEVTWPRCSPCQYMVKSLLKSSSELNGRFHWHLVVQMTLSWPFYRNVTASSKSSNLSTQVSDTGPYGPLMILAYPTGQGNVVLHTCNTTLMQQFWHHFEHLLAFWHKFLTSFPPNIMRSTYGLVLGYKTKCYNMKLL